MKILHTAGSYTPSLDGVAEVVRNISERLAEKGHEVHVATGEYAGQTPYAERRGVKVHRFRAKGNLASGMGGEIEPYREFVRSGDWDVVVNHCVQVWTTDALFPEIRFFPWPSILVTHGLSVHHPAFAKYYEDFPRHLAAYSRWIRVSSCSEEAQFAEQRKLETPPLIRNGVDVREWSNPPLALRRKWHVGRKPWVVNVSNHNPFKNHPAFFDLAKRLHSSEVHFTIVGGTYPVSKWSLGRMGVSGGCAYTCRLTSKLSMGRVSLKTNIPREKVISAIQEADVIVSTSTWEANSVVLLESMAAGTPWVSFDVGAARENAGGVVVRNSDEMAAAVMGLLQDPARRAALGAAGRSRARTNHDWDTLADEYERVYESAVGTSVQACLH